MSSRQQALHFGTALSKLLQRAKEGSVVRGRAGLPAPGIDPPPAYRVPPEMAPPARARSRLWAPATRRAAADQRSRCPGSARRSRIAANPATSSGSSTTPPSSRNSSAAPAAPLVTTGSPAAAASRQALAKAS